MVVAFANAQSREVAAIQEILKATNASWTAGDSHVTAMSPIEQEQLLGLMPGIGDLANLPAPTIISDPVRADRYEAPHTSIKDQGQCGSCYSFGASATYESYVLLTTGVTVDLSEQYFMMKAKEIGPYGGCSGWYLDTSMNLLKDKGVAKEADCPYKAVESACSTSAKPDHKIKSWANTTDKTTIQNALQQYGLVYVGFAVYNDFMSYKKGYYEYKTGSLRGYHAVAIVGYDDKGFKVKNSWGTGWGDGGYFYILYSQMTNSVQFGTCFGGSNYVTGK
jgi:C1A family cysteine protease